MDIPLQLEDSNKTLTKDVENLSKEKAELSETLGAKDEGTVPLLLASMSFCRIVKTLLRKLRPFFSSSS